MENLKRSNNRALDSLRAVEVLPRFTTAAESSVLFSLGKTKVLCTATLEKNLPAWLLGKNQGWLTAEYAMLPRATQKRTPREAVKGAQTGRTQEIQRLIGRSLRAALDLNKIPEHQFVMDCDVLEADGSTRCASICGAFVALKEAIFKALEEGIFPSNPLKGTLSAVSVGVWRNVGVLDLDYLEDSECETDMNVVMLDDKIVEIQGTAEGLPFDRATFNCLLDLAEKGNTEMQEIQNTFFPR